MKILITETQYNQIIFEEKYGEGLASGSQHDVYKIDDDFVLKVPYWGENRYPGEDIYKTFDEHITFMKSYPEIFPDVKKLDKKRASVERIDIDKAEEEILYLFNIITNDKHMNNEMFHRHGWEHLIYDLYNSSRPEVLNTLDRLKQYGKRNKDEVVTKWYNFIKKLKRTFKDRYLDIHSENIGIDKNNEIKLTDY